MAIITHRDPAATITLMIKASDTAIGAVLQQHSNGSWRTLASFVKRVLPAESSYSAFGVELLAVYLAFRHLRHTLEC